MKTCCESMWIELEVEPVGEQHITYHKERGEYGLIDPNDPTSYRAISFCPYCGTALPSKFYSEWRAKFEKSQMDQTAQEDKDNQE